MGKGHRRQLEFIAQVRSYARWANATMLATAIPVLSWCGGWLPLEEPFWLALPLGLGLPILASKRAALACPNCERSLAKGELRGNCPDCGQALLP